MSLRRIALGFVLGSAAGIPIGLSIGSFPLVRKLLEPWTEFLRFIPSVAMITIAVIWFGIGEESKIFLIICKTIFIVIINTAAGVSAIAPNKIRAAQATKFINSDREAVATQVSSFLKLDKALTTTLMTKLTYDLRAWMTARSRTS